MKWDTSAIFPVLSDVGNSWEDIYKWHHSNFICNSHSMADASMWSHRVYRKFELSVFKMTKWCGNPKIVMNVAGIAKYLVALI
jgi:hypothetical protein